MKKKIMVFFAVCALLLILAAIPRSIEVMSGNYVFGFDQGKHWLAAKSIVVDHKFPLIGDEVGGKGGFFQGSGWFYLLALPFFLFHGDPYGAIVMVFVLGVSLTGLFPYLFYKRLGMKEALAGGFFLALAPILISNSRFAWPPFVIPFLMVWYLWFAYGVFVKKYINIFFVFLTIGLMGHFEVATAGTLFISTLLLYIPYSIKEKIPFKYFLFGIVGFILPLTPLLLFDIRHNFLNVRGIMETFFGSKRGALSSVEYGKILSNHWMICTDEFFRAFQNIFIPRIYLTGFMIAGVVAMVFDTHVPNIKKRFVGLLALLPFVLFTVLLLYKNDLWAWWISELTVVYAVLFGILCVYGLGKGWVMRLIVIMFVGLMSFSYVQKTVNSLQKELTDYGGVHKIQGKKDALDVIYHDAGKEKFGVFVFTPPIYTYAYDFVFWWYGQKKYGYVPPNQKLKLFYLLIEPDTGEPWRHNGWMETVIKDGTIEKTWNLPSGFIIQKRRMAS